MIKFLFKNKNVTAQVGYPDTDNSFVLAGSSGVATSALTITKDMMVRLSTGIGEIGWIKFSATATAVDGEGMALSGSETFVLSAGMEISVVGTDLNVTPIGV